MGRKAIDMAAKLLTQTRNIPTNVNLCEPNFLLSHQRVLRQSHLRYLINILTKSIHFSKIIKSLLNEQIFQFPSVEVNYMPFYLNMHNIYRYAI